MELYLPLAFPGSNLLSGEIWQSVKIMNATVEIKLNEEQQAVLERVARLRKVSLPLVLKSAVDEFIERLEDEELLATSDRQAQQKAYKEEDAVALVRAWRQKNYPEKA